MNNMSVIQQNAKEIKIGIIGCGRIARRFCKEVEYVNNMRIVAVYHPTAGRADTFVAENKLQESFHQAKGFSDFQSFVNEIDVGYIATPHETHYGYVDSLLENKIHVLCEKPMVLSKNEAISLFEKAHKNKCVLMECLKTAYCPGYLEVISKAQSGIIGEVRDVECCFTKLEDTNKRELTDVKYGGSFTELGSYVLLPIFELLGTDYQSVQFESINAESGLDLFTKMYLKYDNGTCKNFGSGKVGLGVKSDGAMIISGTKGYIRVLSPWWKTSSYEICFEDWTKNQVCHSEFEGDGLRYELNKFLEILDNASDNSKMEEISIKMADVMEMFLKESR